MKKIKNVKRNICYLSLPFVNRLSCLSFMSNFWVHIFEEENYFRVKIYKDELQFSKNDPETTNYIKFLFGLFKEDKYRKCFLISVHFSVFSFNGYGKWYNFLPTQLKTLKLNSNELNLVQFSNRIQRNKRGFWCCVKLCFVGDINSLVLILKNIKDIKYLYFNSNYVFRVSFDNIKFLGDNLLSLKHFDPNDQKSLDFVLKKKKLRNISMIREVIPIVNNLDFLVQNINVRVLKIINRKEKYIKMNNILVFQMVNCFPNLKKLCLKGQEISKLDFLYILKWLRIEEFVCINIGNFTLKEEDYILCTKVKKFLWKKNSKIGKNFFGFIKKSFLNIETFGFVIKNEENKKILKEITSLKKFLYFK